jgi:hypothetical protein
MYAMNTERSILVAFLGNYLINNIVGAIVALLPLGGSGSTAQYVVYITLAGLSAGFFTWWALGKGANLKSGATFGVVAFFVAVATALVSGIAGVLTQTGSISQLISVLPNFGPFLFNWSTVALLGYWVVPAVVVGFLTQRSHPASVVPAGTPRPMI